MARVKSEENQKINAYFLPETFVIDEVEDPIDEIKESLVSLEADKYGALFHMGFLNKSKFFSSSFEYLHNIAEILIKKISKQPDIEFTREAVEVSLSEEELSQLKEEIPFAIGMEYVDETWIQKLWVQLIDVFRKEIKDYEGTVARYFDDYNSNIHVVGRVFFHLVENNDEKYPFAFMATYSTKTPNSKRAVHTPLKNALSEFNGDDKKLLQLISTVVKAAEKSNFISELLESGELFSPLKFTAEEAHTVLKELLIYEEAGIMCRVPNWWRKKSNSVKVSVSVGEKEPSRVGLDGIMEFYPTLSLGDENLTAEELRNFMEMAEGLMQYKGKWIEINKSKLEEVLKVFDKINDLTEEEALSLGDVIRFELNLDDVLDVSNSDIDISISNGKWLKSMKERLTNPSSLDEVVVPQSFNGILRTYQETGYNWLNQMSKFGFGACLADDMGLGKTIQVIAFLENERLINGGKALLVLPASLIGNWKNEIEKLAPNMPYQILHKSDLKGSEEIAIKEGGFLYITTYGMAVRLEELKNIKWDYMILDEAQAIKNPGTKQTKAIKEIKSKMRIAMTGTPIENRLGDLWSLFDFLNQGLLGTTKEFTNFTKKMSDEGIGYSKLRKIIEPFILRRLKTDKSIITDLPDKIEMDAYTTLTKKQILLYKQLLGEISEKLEELEGIDRKGLVLASIMKFKQICNHPDQYLGREEYKSVNSGKFEKLKEICEVIHEKREKVIIFTQFREITEPISDFLSEIFSKKGLVLHGGTPIKKRSEMVDQFNSEKYIPYMVLSIKAGGVGLNLTAANHVIHFDRWWNPAVENQGTDRAFRIGQTKNVVVHKFVTLGTIEEKINQIIKEKQKISGDILSDNGEKWITEYSNEELMKIFALGGE